MSPRHKPTYSSKALSSARPTNNWTAKARSRRPRRLRRGQSAPIVVRRLDRGEPEPNAPAQAPESNEAAFW